MALHRTSIRLMLAYKDVANPPQQIVARLRVRC